MEAARGAGATGGTTIHAKGTGMELAKKFFGVSIASERELVFIPVSYTHLDVYKRQLCILCAWVLYRMGQIRVVHLPQGGDR